MSITQDKVKAQMLSQLQGLNFKDQFHSVQRMKKKLMLIHNAVGAIYRQVKTISKFQAEYPAVYTKIAPELAPYVVGDYISKAGFDFFTNNIFDPRQNAINELISMGRKIMREQTPSVEVDMFS